MTLKVGFVGPGIMGRPMALNLLRGGHRLWVYGRRPESVRPLTEAGATACASPREVAVQAEVSIVMVSDTPDVEQVIFGADGLLAGARPGSVVVDMGTTSLTATRDFARALAARGLEMLDAPVSGGDVGAAQGTLSIMVGGTEAAFRRVRPLFECMGTNVVHVGENGAGQTAKACNQIVVALTIEAVGEALTFARRNGVDGSKVRQALLGGFAASKILEAHGRRMLERDFRPGFKVRLHQKDMRLVLEAAHQLGLALPGAALVSQQLNALMGAGDAELDSAALVKVVEGMSALAIG